MRDLEDFTPDTGLTHYGPITGPRDGSVTHVEGAFTIPSSGDARFSEWTYKGLIPYTAFAVKGNSGGIVLEAGTSTVVGVCWRF